MMMPVTQHRRPPRTKTPLVVQGGSRTGTISNAAWGLLRRPSPAPALPPYGASQPALPQEQLAMGGSEWGRPHT